MDILVLSLSFHDFPAFNCIVPSHVLTENRKKGAFPGIEMDTPN